MTTLSPTPGVPHAADLLRAAFRDVHGPRLHGFALLLTVGDRSRAGVAAGRALAAGMQRADDLRHPERAAAWLRARVLREVRSGGGRPRSVSERRAVLSELGLAEPATDALGQLEVDERTALIAADVERMQLPDVAIILGTDLAITRRRLAAARSKYLDAASHWLGSMPLWQLPGGDVARCVEATAARAIGPRPPERGRFHD